MLPTGFGGPMLLAAVLALFSTALILVLGVTLNDLSVHLGAISTTGIHVGISAICLSS
jgi:hypothetical protein